MASRWPDDIVLSVKCIPDCVPKASRESGIYYRLRFIFLQMFNIFGPIEIILVFLSTTLLKVQ